ncbi:unnamed protein product, partial [Polarella glacialis]
ANVHGNMYGTSRAAVEAVRSRGQVCVLDLDVQGARLIKAAGFDYKFLFVAPPCMEELEKRLRGRGTEQEDKIQIRLVNARGEMEFCEQNKEFFGDILVNTDLGQTTMVLLDILRRWYPSLVQMVKVTSRRSAGFFIRAARELMADRRKLHAVQASEVEVVGLGNSIASAVAVHAALLEDGHEAVLYETDMVEVRESATNRKTQTPRLRIVIRRHPEAASADHIQRHGLPRGESTHAMQETRKATNGLLPKLD